MSSCLSLSPSVRNHPPPRTCTSPVPGEIHEFTSMDGASLQDTLTKIYSRLPPRELLLLLHLRALPTHGTPQELAYRLAIHELSHRLDLGQRELHTPPPTILSSSPPLLASTSTPPTTATITATKSSIAGTTSSPSSSSSSPEPTRTHPLPHLPPELWAEILDYVHDWELSTALGITSPHLRPPADWTTKATPTDRALLSGHWPTISSALTRGPSPSLPTALGLRAAIRFSYTNVLTRLLHSSSAIATHTRTLLRSKDVSVPMLASRCGLIDVLGWWQREFRVDGKAREGEDGWYNTDALDEASRKGHIHVLHWWAESGLPLRYGLVMDVASSANQIAVLEWWKNSGLQLEYGKRAMQMASMKGLVEVLEWWKTSGLRLVYDKDVLVEATKFNRVNALEWWKESGLKVEYFLIDIEGALEDAIGGGKEARKWWRCQGVTFERADAKEWIQPRVL